MSFMNTEKKREDGSNGDQNCKRLVKCDERKG